MIRRLQGLALAGLLASCAAPAPPAPAEPPIVLSPPAPALPPVAPPAAARAIKRDSAAVQQRARAWIAPPSTPIDKVATLESLTREVNRRLAIMEQRHSPRGYRPGDVANARAAADAVAHFLDNQAQTPAVASPGKAEAP